MLKSLTQEELAIRAGIDTSTIKRYENNQHEVSLEACDQIASALEIEAKLLYDDYLQFIVSGYGHKIKEIRKKLGYTQKEFADILNVHRKTVLRWEKEIQKLSKKLFSKLNSIYKPF